MIESIYIQTFERTTSYPIDKRNSKRSMLRLLRNILTTRYSSSLLPKLHDSVRISIDPSTVDDGYQGSQAGFQETQGRSEGVGIDRRAETAASRARWLAGSHAFVMFIKYRLAGRHRRHRMTSTRLARSSRSGSRPREPFALIGIATIKCVYPRAYMCACPRMNYARNAC